MNRNDLPTSCLTRLAVMAAALLLLQTAPAGSAQAAPPREMAVDLPEPLSETPWLTPVVAAGAHDMVVHDQANLLIVGVSDDETGGALQVFQLDDAGQVRETEPQRLALPRVKQFNDRWIQFPQNMALHAELPLLYVWQHVRTTSGDRPPAEMIHEELDRLLIYKIEGAALSLHYAGVRGPAFAGGGSTLKIDHEHGRLFPPAMVFPRGDRFRTALGWMELDDEGIPRTDDDDSFILETVSSDMALSIYRQPTGTLPIDKRTVIYSGRGRVMTWNVRQSPGKIVGMHLPGSGRALRLVEHPDEPMLYLCDSGGDTLYRVWHAQGQLSLLPRRLTVRDAQFTGGLSVLPASGGNKVLIGGPRCVYFTDVDELGRFTGDVGRVTVNVPAARALTVSTQHGLAYVAVEAEE